MISPELIRRYSFFWCMDDGQQKAVAMVAEQVTYPQGHTIYKADEPANYLYLLMEGSVGLSVSIGSGPEERHLFVGTVSPGEPFGMCSLLPLQKYTATAQAEAAVQAIKMDAQELRTLCDIDCKLGFCLVQQVARAALEQLRTTYVQLAATQMKTPQPWGQ